MPRAGLTPDLIVIAAATLADRDGLDRVTVSAVARLVGVKPASVYAHLDGADDLLSRVTQLALAEMAERAADAVAGRSGRDALAAWAQAFRTYAFAHPGRYAASHRPLRRAEALAGAGPRHTALSASILRGYAVPEVDHVHAVRLLGATIHGSSTSRPRGRSTTVLPRGRLLATGRRGARCRAAILVDQPLSPVACRMTR